MMWIGPSCNCWNRRFWRSRGWKVHFLRHVKVAPGSDWNLNLVGICRVRRDDVQAAVDAVSNLPEAAEDPAVRRGAWRDPVTDVVITGPVGLDQLGRFADEFVTRLFAVGVTRTIVQGVAAPETIVEIPSLSLRQNGVTMAEIARAIAQEAEADPAGDVGSGAARIRTGVAKRSAGEISSIVLRTNSDGSKLTIGDVAQVRTEGIDRDRAYFVGDDPAIVVRISRSDRGDAIKIQARVEAVAEELQLALPAGVTMDLIRTRSAAITNRLNLLMDNGLMGLGLVCVAAVFVSECAHRVLGGCRYSGGDEWHNRDDVSGRADVQHDLVVCADYRAGHCGG